MVKIACYARVSSKNQREESIEDQQRVVGEHFARMGFPTDAIQQFSDYGITGTHTERPGYQRLMKAIEAGHIDVLGVDDQSRLTRDTDIGGLLQFFEFHDVRFVSVADNIDTTHEGSEVNAQVKGLTNNLSNKGHGKRVRRGIVGRVLDGNGAAGDHPYGYRSTFEDPDAAARYNGRGPKPKRILQPDSEESRVVRWIFEMFAVAFFTIHRIARELNAAKTPCGTRSKSKTGWSPARVAKMLRNPKYIGDWRWGDQRTVKLKGKRRNYPARPGEAVRVERPSLAIVPREIWDKAQQRFRRFKEITGQRPVGKKKFFRGVNFRETPTSLMSGLLYCGDCGARLHYTASKTTAYFRCPVKARGGPCKSKSVVIRKDGERVLLDFVREKLSGTVSWVDDVYELVLKNVHAQLDRTPAIKERLLAEKAQLMKEIDNLAANLSSQVSKTLQARLLACEARMEELDRELADLEHRARPPAALPTKDEVCRELADLWPLFQEDPVRGALLLRKAIGKIRVFDVIHPGKKRGYAELRFDFRPSAWLSLAGGIPEVGEEADPAPAGEVRLLTGEPTELDVLMLQIHAWVRAGVPWREIHKRTGKSMCSANLYYNRWLKSVNNKNDDEHEESVNTAEASASDGDVSREGPPDIVNDSGDTESAAV